MLRYGKQITLMANTSLARFIRDLEITLEKVPDIETVKVSVRNGDKDIDILYRPGNNLEGALARKASYEVVTDDHGEQIYRFDDFRSPDFFDPKLGKELFSWHFQGSSCLAGEGRWGGTIEDSRLSRLTQTSFDIFVGNYAVSDPEAAAKALHDSLESVGYEITSSNYWEGEGHTLPGLRVQFRRITE